MKTRSEQDLVSAVTDETPREFSLRCMHAEGRSVTTIEACDDIIDYFNPEGLGAYVQFFTHGKTKVFRQGERDKALTKEAKELKERADGKVAFFEGRT